MIQANGGSFGTSYLVTEDALEWGNQTEQYNDLQIKSGRAADRAGPSRDEGWIERSRRRKPLIVNRD